MFQGEQRASTFSFLIDWLCHKFGLNGSKRSLRHRMLLDTVIDILETENIRAPVTKTTEIR